MQGGDFRQDPHSEFQIDVLESGIAFLDFEHQVGGNVMRQEGPVQLIPEIAAPGQTDDGFFGEIVKSHRILLGQRMFQRDYQVQGLFHHQAGLDARSVVGGKP